jgi:hypothetical protein
MKNSILLAALLLCSGLCAQKKTNGTIYIEHPAIAAVEGMTQAFVKGDATKVGSYLTDDFKLFNGTSSDKSAKGDDKAAFLKSVQYWKDDVDYLAITRSPGAYPDALEYTDASNKDQVWVQTWEDVKGVHNKTGVKIDMPMHRLFVLDKSNKIKTIINYSNTNVGNEIGDSYSDRKNGDIYNHHEYINSVRKMIGAFANHDLEKSYSYYDEKALFYDNNLGNDKSFTLTEQKANDKKLFESFNLVSIDVTGYPDYLHYELGDQRIVQSWWNFTLERKADKKKIVLPMFLIDNFNDKGKITSEIMYYGEKLLEAK